MSQELQTTELQQALEGLLGDSLDHVAGVTTDVAELRFRDGSCLPLSQIERVIPCFTPGSLIATPKGAVDVATLRQGDRVLTRDNGIQTISWLGTKRLNHLDLKALPKLRPILIKAGALGGETPDRDMQVSPTHRMLVVSEVARAHFKEAEVLVPARELLGLDGVSVAETPYATYIHFFCDRHEIVLSDSTWSESFQPGDMSMKGLDQDQREELFNLYPELAKPEGWKSVRPARRTLTRVQSKQLFSF